MADGTYERRGPREAELQRLARLLADYRQTNRVRPIGGKAETSHGGGEEDR